MVPSLKGATTRRANRVSSILLTNTPVRCTVIGAGVFLTSYEADGDLSVACAAVNAFITDNLMTAFWDYGYSNPEFNPAAVCPF